MSGTGALQWRVTSTLEEVRDDWDRLAAHQRVPSPFLRTWWLEAVSGPRAAHLLLFDGPTLVGGVPLVRRRLPGLSLYRFAGQGPLCPDHLDALALPGREDDVIAALADWFTRPGHRAAVLQGLVEDSLLARAWPGAVTAIDVAPYGRLPSSADDYIKSLSGNFRHNIRRSQRRLDDAGAHAWAASADGPFSVERAMDDFRQLQETREGRGHLVAALPTLNKAIAAGVASGEVRVDVIETSQDQPVAVCITFMIGDRVSLYQVARTLDHDYRGAGTAQVAAVVGSSITRGCQEFDMLRGPESYKTSFVGASRDVLALQATHGALGRAFVSLRSRARSSKQALQRGVRRLRAADPS